MTNHSNPMITTRLERLRHLRRLLAPAWIVRLEQVYLALERRGMKCSGIGKPASVTQTLLVEKYVTPLMV